MLSDRTIFRLCKSTAPLCLALFVTLLSPPLLHSAEERSYAHEIQQYVAEDKVYLLENIRQNVTRPSEKIVIDALLSEDGPQAVELYQKQLKDYPDPALDQFSSSRIAAYSMALDSSAPLPKLSRPLLSPAPDLAAIKENTKPQTASIPEKPNREAVTPLPPLSEKPIRNTKPLQSPLPEKLKSESTIAKISGFTLQFGSFKIKENAEGLAKKISLYEPAQTIQLGQLYKVLLKKNYASKDDAADMVKKLPFIAIIVPAKEVQH